MESFARVPAVALDPPVVHEQVWFPDVFGRNSDIHNVSIVRLVPLQVHIVPVLKRMKYIIQKLLAKKCRPVKTEFI